MKITAVIFLLSLVGIVNTPLAFAKDTESKEDKALLDALHSEAEETSMEQDTALDNLTDEPAIIPKAITDYDDLERKVAEQIKGLLADTSKKEKTEKESIKKTGEPDKKLKNELENIVSSELLKGSQLDDIRMAVSAAMMDIKKNSELKDKISGAALESAGEALKSIVAAEKIEPTDMMEVDTVTVQVGENLYKIAQRVYGSGRNYLALFNANKEVIKDPNLIRVGQVLKVP